MKLDTPVTHADYIRFLNGVGCSESRRRGRSVNRRTAMACPKLRLVRAGVNWDGLYGSVCDHCGQAIIWSSRNLADRPRLHSVSKALAPASNARLLLRARIASSIASRCGMAGTTSECRLVFDADFITLKQCPTSSVLIVHSKSVWTPDLSHSRISLRLSLTKPWGSGFMPLSITGWFRYHYNGTGLGWRMGAGRLVRLSFASVQPSLIRHWTTPWIRSTRLGTER